MSGPKSSRYTLTAEQRRALMILRQKQIVQQERIRLSAMLAQIENDARNIQYYSEKNETESDAVRLIQKYSPLLSVSLPDDLDALAAQSNALLSARQTIVQTQQAMKRNANEAKTSWEKHVVQDLSKGFGATLDSALDAKRNKKQQEYQRIITLLEQIVATAVRDETAVQARKLLMQYSQTNTEVFRNTLYTTSIQPLIKQHNLELDRYRQEEGEYQQLLLKYGDLCEELSIPQSPHPWVPGAAESLRAVVEQMEQQILQQEEETYICRALDEVMQEMGYSLLGTREVSKRSGKRLIHTLYTLDDGTAIDVTYSNDGQIAMELGGLDDQDRVPDEQETIYLCDAMEGFCTSFEQIEEKLKRSGVILKERIHMLPPSEENAQIINTEDYRLSAIPSILNVKHRTNGKADNKQMYKDGE